MSDTHLNQHQLGLRWGLSPRTLERWRWAGFGPPHMKIGGRILYRLSDIETYETSHLREGTVKDEGVPLSAAEAAEVKGGAHV